MDRLDRTGLVATVLFVVLVVVGAVQGATGDATAPRDDADPATSLVRTWAATRTLTHRSLGTFERSAPDGRRLAAPTEVVQRPPDRLLRGFDAVSGRRDDRVLVCPAPVDGGDVECSLGRPGPDFEQVVAEEIAGFRSLVTGVDPLYDVRRRSDTCWRMIRTRYDPRPGFGERADLCFDDATGALRSVVIDHGDIVERTTYHSITTEVTDADLEP